MCESASLLAAAGNQDGHHHQGEIKTAEMNTSGLDPPPATLGSAPLPSPSPSLGDEDEDVAATGGTGSTDSRAAFAANTKLYFQILRTAGAAAVAAAFDPPPATLGSVPLPSPSPEGDDAAYQLLGDEDEDIAATGGTGSTGSLAAKLRELVRQKLAEVNASGAVVAGLGLVGSAVGAYFLWPAAAAAATGATMAAPGAVGFVISRAAFAANTKLYFQILHTAGAAAAAAAFAL